MTRRCPHPFSARSVPDPGTHGEQKAGRHERRTGDRPFSARSVPDSGTHGEQKAGRA